MYIVEALPSPERAPHEVSFFIAGQYREVDFARQALSEIILGTDNEDIENGIDSTEIFAFTKALYRQVGKVAIGLPPYNLLTIDRLLNFQDLFLETRGEQLVDCALKGGLTGTELGKRLVRLDDYVGLTATYLTHQGYEASLQDLTFQPTVIELGEPGQESVNTHAVTRYPLRFDTNNLPHIMGEGKFTPGMLDADGVFQPTVQP